MNTPVKSALTLCVLAALCALLAFPARYLACVTEGAALWAACVLPAALPFIFLTALLAGTPLFARLSRLTAPLFAPFGVSGAGGCAALLSLLSGYPAGAKTVQRLYAQGAIGREEALRCACLASTSGPAFLVGTAGAAMTGNAALGWLLLFAHVTGVLGGSLLFAMPRKKRVLRRDMPPSDALSAAQSVPETLAESVLAVLTVGGAVALFYAFGCMLTDALAPLGLPPAWSAFLAGLLEMTAGCSRLLPSPTPAALAGAAFLVTFGGACVLMQQWCFLSRTGIPLAKFLGMKAVQAGFAALTAFALGTVFLQ